MLRADGFGFLPIILLWAFAVAAGKISQAAKKARSAQPGPDGEGPASRQDDLRSQLRAAMEDLKQAESQSKRNFTVTLQPPARPRSLPPPASRLVVDRSAAFARLEEMQKDVARRASPPSIQPSMTPSGAAAPAAPAAEPAARNPLANYADGSARSAFVIAEILGRPRGESL